jgi:glycogen debranching enzyme
VAPRVQLRAQPDYHFAYSGRSLLATARNGWVDEQGIAGFYVDETRLLSRHEITVDGQPLTTFAVSSAGGDAFFFCAKPVASPNIPADTVFAEILISVEHGLRERIRFENYHVRDPARFTLAIQLAADFADLTEAREGRRQQTANVATRWEQSSQVLVFSYEHPKLDRAVEVRVERSPAPFACQDGALIADVELRPHDPVEIEISVTPVFDARRDPPPGAQSLPAMRAQLRQEATRLTSTNQTVASAWNTAVDDLASLPLGLAPGPLTPIAGVPMYQQFFGRDTLTTAWQALLALPAMMKDTLILNAAWQGTSVDNWRDEEPGKMIHQARWGPLSLLGIDPFDRYYGDYATPPDFLIMLGQYLAWTNDLDTVRELLPAADKALTWLERYGDLDGDGFVEYVSRSERGVENQGWKDSHDAVVDERGNIVKAPIATSELQAYWYAGLELVAPVYFLAGERRRAVQLLREARALKRRFDDAFWMEDLGFYAFALGPDKAQVRSIASNAGHLLAAGIVPEEKGERVAKRLMEPDLFSGWGVRTLSSAHPAYNPFSYHLGSVWPVENGTFALGLARYGCWDELHRLAEGLFAATELCAGHRLPEALGGLPRDDDHPHPGIYPESNAPQSWSASMIILLVQSLLGMRPVAPLRLLVIDPHLPEWLPDLRLAGVRVGDSVLDLEFERTTSGETRYHVSRQEGHVRVIRQPVPQGDQASLLGRAKAALGSLPRS